MKEEKLNNVQFNELYNDIIKLLEFSKKKVAIHVNS